MKVYFDVGAHDGRDGFGSLIDAKYQKCYAFEIDKRMIDKIKGSSKVWGDVCCQLGENPAGGGSCG